ncbi:hypothetical protein JIN85_19820 [Luteolibacter pohnpeiensis]|uniref:Uncharacterized protein n=1 Tax=Luteolibacter pohnpeiensis TaxID=454153 RepID=A0A934SB56_9BACT|nr:hypothetical protein [Luteolibacter pohnpeiensis]MBK1884669.1 hypothetical protein [Luteolibacter pohnpeiensis]
MSVHLIPVNPPEGEEDDDINITNGEWCAMCALANAFGIDVSPPENHDEVRYSPEVLRDMATRIEQIKDAPEWLRWLAECGGANLA